MVSGPVKLSRTEQVVAKQLYSPGQQNRVERLLINAVSVLDTVFQVKNGATLSLFSWESPHSSLALAGGPTSKKDNPTAIQLRRGTSSPTPTCELLQRWVDIPRVIQAWGGPHLPSRGTDQIWTCRV